jgi:hypothetical protein
MQCNNVWRGGGGGGGEGRLVGSTEYGQRFCGYILIRLFFLQGSVQGLHYKKQFGQNVNIGQIFNSINSYYPLDDDDAPPIAAAADVSKSGKTEKNCLSLKY